MGEVVLFVPRAERDSSANLAEFIRLAKEDLTAFADGGAWDSDRWKHKETVVVFATKTAALNSYSFTPMGEPFKQFAKAYISYQYSHRPVKSLAMMLQALRCIEAGLLGARGRADIALLTGAVMDVCAQKCREHYFSEDVHHKTGLQMQAVFDFLREQQLVSTLPAWKSPFRKPVILTEDLGEAGRTHREAKLPSSEVMFALAEVFAQADEPETRFYSSISILLMAAPSRISEVLKLPVDCIQWEDDERGQPQMFLRWRAAKGKGATKKWVVPAMRDVVQEAVRRLVEIGEPARIAARFAYDNPGRFMQHPGCLNDPEAGGDGVLGPEEFCRAIGLKSGRQSLSGAASWIGVVGDKKIARLIREGRTTFAELADYVLEMYCGASWPWIDEDKVVLTWDALCLHRQNEFHPSFKVKYFSWRLPRQTEVNDRLSPEKGLSLFRRMGIKNSDGSEIKITTHQLRHWLSTMSERAGMDDYTLAQWAGRARLADNRHYDHRTPEERLAAARSLLPIQPAPLLERIKNRQPVTYQELGVNRPGAAKATLYGMCLHDYAMAPCQKQRECMTCKEHVCIKGDHITLERILLLEAQTEVLLQQAQKAHEEGYFGADRWVDNHKWKLAHVRAMRMALEHPSVPNGAALRIPDEHDPSPVRRALIGLGLVEEPAMEALGPRVIPLALN